MAIVCCRWPFRANCGRLADLVRTGRRSTTARSRPPDRNWVARLEGKRDSVALSMKARVLWWRGSGWRPGTTHERLLSRFMRSDAPVLAPTFRSRTQGDLRALALLHPDQEWTVTDPRGDAIRRRWRAPNHPRPRCSAWSTHPVW